MSTKKNTPKRPLWAKIMRYIYIYMIPQLFVVLCIFLSIFIPYKLCWNGETYNVIKMVLYIGLFGTIAAVSSSIFVLVWMKILKYFRLI